MTYEELVSEGRSLVSARVESGDEFAWKMGNIFSQVPDDGIEIFAEQIGWFSLYYAEKDRPMKRIIDMIETVQAFDHPGVVSFRIHTILRRHPDRLELVSRDGLTVAEANRIERMHRMATARRDRQSTERRSVTPEQIGVGLTELETAFDKYEELKIIERKRVVLEEEVRDLIQSALESGVSKITIAGKLGYADIPSLNRFLRTARVAA